MKTIRILILEDDLETKSIISTVTLSEYTQVEEIINKNKQLEFDVVLLDRDCKAGGSFHVLDIERLGIDKVISISSIPQYNQQAQARGVKKVVWKDYTNLDAFSDMVIDEVKKLI